MDVKMLIRTAFSDPEVKNIHIIVMHGKRLATFSPGCMEDVGMYYEKNNVNKLIMTKCECKNGNLSIYCDEKY